MLGAQARRGTQNALTPVRELIFKTKEGRYMAASISESYSLASNYETAQTSASGSYSTFFSDIQQLGQALQSGNLSDAQSAYNNAEQLVPSGAQNGPLATALSAVGQALQSGNLSGAQQAFSSVQHAVQTVLSEHHGHGHHEHVGVSGTAPSASSTPTSSSTSSDASLLNTIAQDATTTATQQASNSLNLLNLIA